MTTMTTLLTSGLGSDDAVRDTLANEPDGTSLVYPKGATGERFRATKSNGHVTIAPVTPTHHGDTREVVTDAAVLSLVGSVGVWVTAGYTPIVLQKGASQTVPMGTEIEIYSRNNKGFFDGEVRTLAQTPGVCANYQAMNTGGAARQQLEHMGDKKVSVNRKTWLKHIIKGLGHEDAAVLITGYEGKKCVDFGLAVLCLIDHENRIVYVDPLYNNEEEIGKQTTFQIPAVILANSSSLSPSSSARTFTYLSISSTEGVTAFDSDVTIPNLTYETTAVRDAFGQIALAKAQLRREMEARRARLTGTAVPSAPTPPPAPPVSARSSTWTTDVHDCLYVVAPGAESLVPSGKPCLYITDKGLATTRDATATGELTSPLYISQALSPGYTLRTTKAHARITVSSAETLPKGFRTVVALTEASIRDGHRSFMGYINNTLFLLASSKAADCRGAALVEKLQANIVSALGDGSWLVVQTKDAEGQTEWLHCAGSMDGPHATGEVVTKAVNTLLANPRRRLPEASVADRLMVTDPFHHQLAPYEEVPGLVKALLEEEDALTDHHQKQDTYKWLDRVTTTLRVLSREATMELVAACGQVERELVSETMRSVAKTPLRPEDVGTEAYEAWKVARKRCLGRANAIKTLLKTHLYDKMLNRGSSGTGRLGVGPKLAARAAAIQKNSAAYEELSKDPLRMSEHLEACEGMLAVPFAITTTALHQSNVAMRKGKYISPLAAASANGRTFEASLGSLDAALLTDNALRYPDHPLARPGGEWAPGGPDAADYYDGGYGFLYLLLFSSLESGIDKVAADGTTMPLDCSTANKSLEADVSFTIQMLATMVAKPTASTRDLPPLALNDPKVLRWVGRFLGDVMLRLARRSSSNGPTEGEYQTMCKRLAVLQLCVWGTGAAETVTSGMCFFSSSARPKDFAYVPSQWRELAQFLYTTLKLTDWTHLYERSANWLRSLGINRRFVQKKVARHVREAKDKARQTARAKQGDVKQQLESVDYHRIVAECFEQVMRGGEVDPVLLERCRYLGERKENHQHDCFHTARSRRRTTYRLLHGDDPASLPVAGMRSKMDTATECTAATVAEWECFEKHRKDLKNVWNRLTQEERGELWAMAPKVLARCLGEDLLTRTLSKPTPPNVAHFAKAGGGLAVAVMRAPPMRKVVEWVRERYSHETVASYHFVYFFPDWDLAATASVSAAATPTGAATTDEDTADAASLVETVSTPAQRRVAVEETLSPLVPAEDWADVREVLHAGPRAAALLATGLGIEVRLWHAFNAFHGWTVQSWADGLLAALEAPDALDVEDRIAAAMPARPLVAGTFPNAQTLMMAP